MDVAQRQCLGLGPYGLSDDRLVGHRVGISHGEHGGETALGGSLGAGLDGLGILAAGLAQVDVHIHQARQEHVALAVDNLCILGFCRVADGSDDAVLDHDIGGLAFAVQAHILNHQWGFRRRGKATGFRVSSHCLSLKLSVGRGFKCRRFRHWSAG